MKNMFKKYGFMAVALALVISLGMQAYAQDTDPEVQSDTLVVEEKKDPEEKIPEQEEVVSLDKSGNEGGNTTFNSLQGSQTDSREVGNEGELKDALNEPLVKKIILKNHILLTTVDGENKISAIVKHGVEIDGSEERYTVSFQPIPGWNGHYVFQVDTTESVVFKNIKITGGDAAILLVKTPSAKFENVDVSGNEFGGIEVKNTATIDSIVRLENRTEAYGFPTIWTDFVESATDYNPLTKITKAHDSKGHPQDQYYVNSEIIVNTLEQLTKAIANTSVKSIKFGDNITSIADVKIDRPSLSVNGDKKILTGRVLITASDVSVTGLTVTNPNYSGPTIHGFQIWGGNSGLSNVILKDNKVENVKNAGTKGAYGIMVQGNVSDIVVESNTISGIESNGWARGIEVTPASGIIGVPQNVLLKKNSVSGIVSPTDAFAFSIDASGAVVADASEITLEGNTFDGKVRNLDVENSPVIDTDFTDDKTEVEITRLTPDVVLTVSSDVKDPALNLVDLKNTDGSVTTGGTIAVTTETRAGVVGVTIAPETTITASGTWDGVLVLPTKVSNSSVTPQVGAQQTASVVMAIEVGANTTLTFDRAVQLVFPGQAGARVGFTHSGAVLTEITATCVANALPAGSDECKMDVGGDLVVLTNHFTTFATYTVATTPSGSTGGSSTRVSGGGGGRVVVTTPVVTTPVAPVAPVGQVLGETTFNFTALMKVGTRSNEVKELQTMLNAGNFGVLAVDGIFGPMTKQAVMAFQRANLLVADGIVGPLTRAALNK